MKATHVATWGVGMLGAAAILGGLWLDTADHREAARLTADTGNVLDLAQLQEDDPGWNCLTMGDGRCGDGFVYWEPDGRQWMFCPAPMTGVECNVPYRK